MAILGFTSIDYSFIFPLTDLGWWNEESTAQRPAVQLKERQ